MVLDVGIFPVQFSVNYNDYNYVFVTFCMGHGKGFQKWQSRGSTRCILNFPCCHSLGAQRPWVSGCLAWEQCVPPGCTRIDLPASGEHSLLYLKFQVLKIQVQEASQVCIAMACFQQNRETIMRARFMYQKKKKKDSEPPKWSNYHSKLSGLVSWG